MKNQLIITGIQADLKWENPKQNLDYFQQKIESISKDTDIVVLPEMFTTGFSMNAKVNAEPLDGTTISWMIKIAKATKFAICGSLPIKENNQYYNRFVFIHPSGKIDTYNKRHVFTYAKEDEFYSPGTSKKVIDFKGWKIFPQICYDLRFPVWSRNTFNYDLLIYVANWPSTRIDAWKTLLKARAIENMTYTIGINRIGKDHNGLIYSGDSLIVDYLGETLSKLNTSEEGFVTAILEKDKQELTRNKLGFLKDRDSFSIHL